MRRSAAYFVSVSTCSLIESLLSRITPKYLSDITLSRGVKLWVGSLTFGPPLASVMVLSSISIWDGGDKVVDRTKE